MLTLFRCFVSSVVQVSECCQLFHLAEKTGNYLVSVGSQIVDKPSASQAMPLIDPFE